MSEIKIKINGIEVTGQSGDTILALAKKAGIKIPTLCHDDRTRAYGSCGICVVEEEGKPRLLRACSTTALNGMSILTDTERVHKTRKTVLELLLSDHTGDCRPPCMLACPAQTDCQGYVGLIANGQYQAAAELIKDKIPMPSSIGRVCPHPCEDACRRELVEEPISISYLKFFATDQDFNNNINYTPEIASDTGKKIAVIGGGPGGLSAAYFLRQKGHSVTIFEQMPEMGGMLRYGIPEYRLPRNIIAQEVKNIQSMGVVMKNNVTIGKDVQFLDLKNEYDAVIVAIGAWQSVALGCPGEDLDGVVGGIDFLRESAMHKAESLKGKKAAIVGGGNTAMDACRTAMRLGADAVYNIYRRTIAEMPAEQIEIDEAIEEGVTFLNLTNPIEILGENGKAVKIRLQKMQLGEPDQSGRRAPVPIEGEEQVVDVDLVIAAIGQSVKLTGLEGAGFDLTRRKTIAADENTFRTNVDGVFAIGDATNKGPDIAISAIGEARKAALVIDSYLNGLDAPYKEPFYVKQELTAEDFADKEKINRAKMPHLSPEERKRSFNEVNHGFDEETARKEASRCLECGCHDYFECKLIEFSNQYNVEPQKFDGFKHNRPISDDHKYILRNSDKCILCGLCTRICDEAVGATAFGLVHRGFDTVVQPALALPLSETDCINCGQCVSACPTGALMEKITAHKSVPVAENITHSTCAECSVGCKVKIASKGNMVTRILPDLDNDPKSLLCEKGRFGFYDLEKSNRLTSPKIKKDGVLQSVCFDEASTYIKDSINDIKSKHGENSIGVLLSPKLTNEEIEAAIKFARDVIKTDNIFAASRLDSKVSTASFDELVSAKEIVAVCASMLTNWPVAALKLKQAVNNGAKLTLVCSPYFSRFMTDWADKVYNLTDDLSEISALITPETFLLADAGLDLHHNAEKVIYLKRGANNQGLQDLGIKGISNIDLECLISFGENPLQYIKGASGINFILTMSSSDSNPNTTFTPNVILPLATAYETSGTIKATDNTPHTLTAALTPPSGKSNLEIINSLI